jgi:tetratricopeptide (TPR) repeat protein
VTSFLSGDDLLTPELLKGFSERISESLNRQPLELEPGDHRKQLADLLSRAGHSSHYELLGLEETAGETEIYDAYLERARLVHPSHVSRLSLEGLAAGPELLFERCTLAYLTLSDEDRRLEYHREIGLASATSGPVPIGEERRAEERDLAERNFKLARKLEAEGEYFYAIELLHVAVRVNQKPEYLALLGRCQSENPKWRRKAIQNYLRAIELNPCDDESRLAAASLYELDGNLPMARREYAALLERVPGHPDAVDALKRLKG